MKKRRLTPTGNRIVVVLMRNQFNAASQLKGPDGKPLIIIPDIIQETTNWGVVEAVGPKCKYLHKGYNVIVKTMMGRTIEFNGHKMLMMTEDDVLAIVYDERFMQEAGSEAAGQSN